MIEIVNEVNRGFATKYPKGIEPFQIMTRILEDAGELAQQVNLFEGSGIKQEKHGEPNRAHLAHEAFGLLITLFQLIDYYELHQLVQETLESARGNLRRDGYLVTPDEA
jgi:NTP pyrophosphatase (non-canonical NTP hydrolase)